MRYIRIIYIYIFLILHYRQPHYLNQGNGLKGLIMLQSKIEKMIEQNRKNASSLLLLTTDTV